MISYSQRDPQWAGIKIGSTNQTIGRVGCLITSIADISSYFGYPLTPEQVNHMCQFTDDARLLWLSCKFPLFSFFKRYDYYDEYAITRAMRDKNYAVVLEVQGGSHWVAPVRWNYFKNAWTICDPWTGTEESMRKYANDITGAAIFKRN